MYYNIDLRERLEACPVDNEPPSSRVFSRRQPQVKTHTSPAIAKVLIAAIVTICASSASAGQNSLRAQAEAELAHVTVDVDSANIMYSPADDGLGANFTKVEEYQQE